MDSVACPSAVVLEFRMCRKQEKMDRRFMLHVNRELGRDTKGLLNKAHLPQHVAFG
jgi:hypothetical protein